MSESEVGAHYRHGDLLNAIAAALAAQGKSLERLRVEDLAPVDEFHIGGQPATAHLLEQLAVGPEHRVLDVGCGTGGCARLMASQLGCRVDGVDLTPEFVQTGRAMTEWLGLSDRVALHRGDALALPFTEATFDRAVMLHVGMNIEAKAALFAEVARVLRPGGVFGVYDILQVGPAPFQYPMPWASAAAISHLGDVDAYRDALQAAGFELLAVENRGDFARDFFARSAAAARRGDAPPPLSLHTLMGQDAAPRLKNLAAAVAVGALAPVEFVARKR